MISANEAGCLIATLPATSFIREYCIWASQCTDAPLAYHISCALNLMGTIAKPGAGLTMGIPIHAPQWTMLVGDSGSSRKSSAIHCATRVLHKAASERIGPTPGSVQGLYQTMHDNGAQFVIPYSEFGTFLSNSKPGGTLAPLREAFTSLWDAVSIKYKTVKQERVIDEPRLSLLVGTTTSYLEAHTTHVDWEGGFLSRWMVIHAKREFSYVLPPGNTPQEDALVERLRTYHVRNPQTASGLAQDAWDFYEEWFRRVADKATEEATSWASGLANRSPTIALKTAIGHAFDNYPDLCETPGWKMPIESMAFGTAIAEWHLRSAQTVLESLATSKAGREQRAVMQAIGEEPRTLGAILNRVNPAMDKREVQRVLDTLMEAGRLFVHQVPGGVAYSVESSELPAGTVAIFRPQWA